MRKIDYETFQREKKERAEAVWKIRGGKLPRRRPRSKAESDLLLKMDLMRQKNWIKSGKLEILGKRKYKLNLP